MRRRCSSIFMAEPLAWLLCCLPTVRVLRRSSRFIFISKYPPNGMIPWNAILGSTTGGTLRRSTALLVVSTCTSSIAEAPGQWSVHPGRLEAHSFQRRWAPWQCNAHELPVNTVVERNRKPSYLSSAKISKAAFNGLMHAFTVYYFDQVRKSLFEHQVRGRQVRGLTSRFSRCWKENVKKL